MLHFWSRHYVLGDSKKSSLFYIIILASAQIFEHHDSAAHAVVAFDIVWRRCPSQRGFHMEKNLIWSLGNDRSGRLFSLVKFL